MHMSSLLPLNTVWAAVGTRVADIRETLSLSLQKHLLQADSASRETAAIQRLEALMQAHDVHALRLE